MSISRSKFVAKQKWEISLFVCNQAKVRLAYVQEHFPKGHKLIRDAARDLDLSESRALAFGMAVLEANR